MHVSAYSQNMVREKHAQRLEPQCPLSCPKEGRPYNMRQLQGCKPKFLPIAYKVRTDILCERLKPLVKTLIGPYQCGFIPGKSTIDQNFTLRQILEKTPETQVDIHNLFVDFDSPIRDRVFAVMCVLVILAKLIRL